MGRKPMVPPHLRNDVLLLKAIERYVFFLQMWSRLALFITDKNLLSCDANDTDRMEAFERRWKLVGVYDRHANALQILSDVRAAGATK